MEKCKPVTSFQFPLSLDVQGIVSEYSGPRNFQAPSFSNLKQSERCGNLEMVTERFTCGS